MIKKSVAILAVGVATFGFGNIANAETSDTPVSLPPYNTVPGSELPPDVEYCGNLPCCADTLYDGTNPPVTLEPEVEGDCNGHGYVSIPPTTSTTVGEAEIIDAVVVVNPAFTG